MRKDLTGQKFGILTVIGYSHKSKHGHSYWRTICDCSNEKIVQGYYLKRMDTPSCGCLNAIGSNHRHGMYKTRIYKTWLSMKDRCCNKNNKNYKYYGGRGINVCSRWHSFTNFYDDMGDRPENMSIERMDNDGNYETGNCKWATAAEQGANKRNNRILQFNGITLNTSQWARKIGMTPGVIYERLKRGWSVEKILTTPCIYRKTPGANIG